MADSIQIIIVISRKKIKIYAVTPASSSEIKKTQEFEWHIETLPEIVGTIKSEFGTKVRILFTQELVYITTLKTDSPHTITRTFIHPQSPEVVPEGSDLTSFDYRVYPEYIQIVSFNSQTYNHIVESIQRAGISIETVEPYSSVIGRFFVREKEPIIVAHQGEESFVIAYHQGVVLNAQAVSGPVTALHIEQAVQYCREKFQLSIKKIIKSETVGDVFTGEFFKDYIIETKNVEQAVGFTTPSEAIVPDAISSKQTADLEPVNKNTRFQYIPVLMFLMAFCLTFASVFTGQKYLFKTDAVGAVPTPSPTIIPTVVQTPTIAQIPSAVVEKVYTVEILNGTGVPGEATELSQILAEHHYTVSSIVNTDNAPTGIAIHYNASVDETYLKDLESILEKFYSPVSVELKVAFDEADITLIIGAADEVEL